MSSKRTKQLIPIPGLILSVLGAGMIYLCSQFTFPVELGSVPVTGQTFAVLIVGYFAGALWGPIGVVLYIACAFAGLPILSSEVVGMDIIKSSSAGYLVGFILASWLVAIDGKWYQVLFWCLMAHLIILLFGGVGLIINNGLGYEDALKSGVLPYWPGGVLKSILATIIIVGGDALITKLKS